MAGGTSRAEVSRAVLRPARVRIPNLVRSLRRAASPRCLPGPRPGNSHPSPSALKARLIPRGWAWATVPPARSRAIRFRCSSTPVTNFKVFTKIYKAAIKANSRLDADRDGVACEKR